MYKIGDKIVYPMHGAGVIESIEEKDTLGSKHSYYIVRMPVGNMKVMIPTDNVDDIGIRDIVSSEVADKVIKVLKNQNINATSNWNKRYRENMFKIKTGNIFEVADVVRSLMQRDKLKGLSTGERKMLNSARQILISELVLVKDEKACEIEGVINECLTMNL